MVDGFFCTPAGVRTLDTLIKSQVLYQLSYKRIISKKQFRVISELRVQRYAFFLNPPNIFSFFSVFLLKFHFSYSNSSFPNEKPIGFNEHESTEC